MESNLQSKHPEAVFAGGFDNPRGLKFGPDHSLYVAEGGSGGTYSTVETCEQVPAPIGPYKGGKTARISKVGPDGARATVVEGLPSDSTSPESGGTVSGVADIAFADGTLYALLAAGGCSHGNPDVPNGIIRVNPGGTWDLLANLSEFLMSHPVKNPDLDDYEPDGTWYSMIFYEGAFYAVEPHNGEVDRINLDGDISRLVDISASQGHVIPTSISVYQNDFFVGNLTRFPLQQDAAKIFKIELDGRLSVFKTGFTCIQGILLDRHGRIYVLESNVSVPFPAPDKGRVIRINRNGSTDIIITGLSRPAAMTFGPDGRLYVSNKGYGYPPGMGEIVRVEIGN